MNINSISKNAISNQDKTNINNDLSLEVQQLEKRKEKLKEELQHIDEKNKNAKTNTPRQEYIKKQIDRIDNKINQLSKKEAQRTNNHDKVTSANKFPVDKFIKSDDLSTENITGNYHLEKDNNGKSRIAYDMPITSESASGYKGIEPKQNDKLGKEKPDVNPVEQDEKDKKDEAPEKSSDDSSSAKKIRLGIVNTDKVDAEIRKLEKEKQQIKQDISRAAGDDSKREKLEKRLEAIETELSYKDNDVYRKQHAEYTESN